MFIITRLLPLMFSKLLCFAMLQLALINTMGGAHVLEQRDFSTDLRNFNQIVQLLYNIRSRIGIPFSAMTNVGLSLPQILEIGPLDLALLPFGYCFSCDTIAHSKAEDSRLPTPFENRMVEIDEEQIIIICAEVDEEHGPELPFLKACPGQQEVLKHFLADLRTRGSRLAVPKERLEKAPLLEWKYATGGGGYRCVPEDESGTGCSVGSAQKKTVEFVEVTGPATTMPRNGNFADFQKSIYLGAGAGLTSAVSATSIVFATSSQTHSRPMQVLTDREHILPSGYYESFWSSLFGAADGTSASVALSTPLPSTLVSMFHAGAQVSSTSAEKTTSEASPTKIPFRTTGSSAIMSLVTMSSAVLPPKNYIGSSKRNRDSWSSILSSSTATKRLVTRHTVSASTQSSLSMQSSSILPTLTGDTPKGRSLRLLSSKQSFHLSYPGRQGTYEDYAARRSTTQPTYNVPASSSITLPIQEYNSQESSLPASESFLATNVMTFSTLMSARGATSSGTSEVTISTMPITDLESNYTIIALGASTSVSSAHDEIISIKSVTTSSTVEPVTSLSTVSTQLDVLLGVPTSTERQMNSVSP